MKSIPERAVEAMRETSGRMGTTRADGNNGLFRVPCDNGVTLLCMVSDGLGWEHASVSVIREGGRDVHETRCPTYEEMDRVKRLFWRDNETVMQLHVPRTLHVNYHATCLHLWRPLPDVAAIPLPHPLMVGPDGVTKPDDTLAKIIADMPWLAPYAEAFSS